MIFQAARRLARRLEPARVDDGPVLDLVALGLDHLTPDQRIGVRDDRLGGFYDRDRGELFEGFWLGRDQTLVDVGCGRGNYLEFCSGFVDTMIGLDVSSAAIGDAVANLSGCGVTNAHLMVASAESLPLPSGWADRVICSETLEHVDDPHRALTELNRIGKPGALYLMSVPDPASEALYKEVGPPQIFEKPHHIRIIARDEFETMVTRAGLEVVSHRYNGFFRAMWLCLFWMKAGQVSDSAHQALPTEFVEFDPVLAEWRQLWSDLLDRPHGEEIKHLLDRMVPKSQIIVARKV